MGLEVDQRGDGGIKDCVPRLLGIEPDMMAPGLRLMSSQHPPHGRGRDGLYNPLSDELPHQFGTMSRREATDLEVRTCAREAHHVDRHLKGGKTALGATARGVRETSQAFHKKPSSPFPQDRALDADSLCHMRARVPSSQEKNDLPPTHQPRSDGG